MSNTRVKGRPIEELIATALGINPQEARTKILPSTTFTSLGMRQEHRLRLCDQIQQEMGVVMTTEEIFGAGSPENLAVEVRSKSR
ncbi:MAG: hypothetical protein PHS53_04680 [Candidatus Pacebacteria bacterium]|nr:hypothetical protein [Candidatus Paceibacterota bacterium]MDD5357414.1 hypothetical protein [Candidatus Paceibacterota bacterium]